jgi:hypothetical protein
LFCCLMICLNCCNGRRWRKNQQSAEHWKSEVAWIICEVLLFEMIWGDEICLSTNAISTISIIRLCNFCSIWWRNLQIWGDLPSEMKSMLVMIFVEFGFRKLSFSIISRTKWYSIWCFCS